MPSKTLMRTTKVLHTKFFISIPEIRVNTLPLVVRSAHMHSWHICVKCLFVWVCMGRKRQHEILCLTSILSSQLSISFISLQASYPVANFLFFLNGCIKKPKQL